MSLAKLVVIESSTSQSGLERCSERDVERTLKTASSEAVIFSTKVRSTYGGANNFWIEASCVQPACLGAHNSIISVKLVSE